MKKKKLSKLNKKYRFFHKSETIFRKWLYENINRFNNKPTPNGRGGYYFKGITKAITLHIDFRLPDAYLSFSDINENDEDNLYDFYSIQWIGNQKYHSTKGFYDADRVDKVYTYHNSYAALIINEVYEPIIEYCNANFTKENALYLINYHGSTEGFIESNVETDLIKINKVKLKNDGSFYIKNKILTNI